MSIRFAKRARSAILDANCLRISVCLCLCAIVWCQDQISDKGQSVRFVQFTDAHIFDDGWKETVAGAMRIAADDREALTWAIAETNHLVSQGQHIDFAVFTGDLGLQNVEILPPCKAQPVPFEPGLPPVRFDSAVREAAEELRQLSVKTIYFVPGNNDIVGEQITDLPRYSCFISELQKQLASGPSPTTVAMLELRNTFLLNGVRFTGLDSSTFKNAANYQSACASKSPSGTKRLSALMPGSCPQIQLAYLRKFVSPSATSPLIIFTHVPDVNDPFRRSPTWGDFAPDLRKDWDDEACRPNVIGIFAGHLHDPDRRYYGSPTGAQLLATTACIAAKTWIAPPLAVKNQQDRKPQARGFLVATVSPSLGIHAVVYWFELNQRPQHECTEKHSELHWCDWVQVSLLLLLLALVGLVLWLTLSKRWSKLQNRDVVAVGVVLLFLLLSFAILWFVRFRIGITETTLPIAILFFVILVYGVASGRLTEFTGPGGWGAKFREVASSRIDVSEGRVDLTNAEMENIRKTGLAEIENRLRTLIPGKPVILSLTIGKGDYYDAFALHSSVQALMRMPNFRFVVFLTKEGILLCYMTALALLHLLEADQNGVMPLGGSGRDLVDAINRGDINRILSYPGMIRNAINVNTSNEQALELMQSIGFDAIVVVTQQGIPVGVAERGPIISRMIMAVLRGNSKSGN